MSERDVVGVAFNYRLSVFGMLSTPEAGISNLGFQDMIFALKWVQSNIEQFGGDSKVT